MLITNKEFHNLLSLVIGELVFLEQQGKQEEIYYKELFELKRKLMILTKVKRGWLKWQFVIMVMRLKLKRERGA